MHRNFLIHRQHVDFVTKASRVILAASAYLQRRPCHVIVVYIRVFVDGAISKVLEEMLSFVYGVTVPFTYSPSEQIVHDVLCCISLVRTSQAFAGFVQLFCQNYTTASNVTIFRKSSQLVSV